MAGSTLDPDNVPRRSDSGSDMKGPGLVDDDALHLDRGTNEDPEGGKYDEIEAGASVGDREMDRPNKDRDTDRVVDAGEAGLGKRKR